MCVCVCYKRERKKRSEREREREREKEIFFLSLRLQYKRYSMSLMITLRQGLNCFHFLDQCNAVFKSFRPSVWLNIGKAYIASFTFSVLLEDKNTGYRDEYTPITTRSLVMKVCVCVCVCVCLCVCVCVCVCV